MSRKILDLAREQQEEVSRELGDDDDEWDDDEPEPSARPRGAMMDESDDEEIEDGDMSGGEEEAELVGNRSGLCLTCRRLTPRTTERLTR